MVLKSEACHSEAENSMIIDERVPVTIEAASIEFTSVAIEENVRSQLLSSVTLEAVGTHGPSKVSIATIATHYYCMETLDSVSSCYIILHETLHMSKWTKECDCVQDRCKLKVGW